jgi:hypothetical protein
VYNKKSKSKLCYDRRWVGQSLLVLSIHLGLKTRFWFLSDNCWFVDVGRPLWREDESLVYNSCCPSPAQSFLGQSPAGLMTTSYCLTFETPPSWRAGPFIYIPQGQGSPVIPPGTGLTLFEVLGKINRLLSFDDTDRIENDASDNSSNVSCEFVAAVTFLLSRCLRTYTYRYRVMWGICEVRRWDGLRCHDIRVHTKFHKDSFKAFKIW